MAGKLTLYGFGHSPYVRRVMVALYEMGVEDFDLEVVFAPAGDAQRPEYLAKQPFGKVPMLEDDGECIYESRAIMRYVADKFGGANQINLLGGTALERGRISQWIDIEALTYTPSMRTVVFERIFKPFLKGAAADQGKVEEALGKLHKTLDVYEQHLEGRAYLVGASFSLADLTHLPYTELLKRAGVFDELIGRRPNVKAWWERISARQAWKRVQEREPYPSKPEGEEQGAAKP